MKKFRLFIYLFSSLLLNLSIYSCKDKNLDDNDFLSLEETSINFDYKQSDRSLKITSSSEWTLTDIPNWCKIDHASGKSNMIINITIEENQTYNCREAKLKIANQGSVEYLYLKQSGIEKQTELVWQPFPVNSIDFVDFVTESDKIKYTFRASEIFVNSHISDKIYLGNIISSTSESNDFVKEFKGYQYNPISIGVIGGKFYSDIIIPSKQEFNKLVNKVIQELPEQNQGFNHSTPISYHSYRQLYLLGYGNITEDFCKLITNKDYNETKMEKGIGLIYTYKMQYFKIQMDYPEKLIKDDVSEDFIHKNNLSYIASVSYGRTAYLIIESDYDKILINDIVNKIIKGNELSEYQNIILENLDIYYLHYTKEGTLVLGNNSNKKESILAYRNSINENEIIPISFTLNDFSNHSTKSFDYSLTLKQSN